jgi:hypothetical protein
VLGSAVHAVLEHYLSTGESIRPTGRPAVLAAQLVPLLPDFSPFFSVEQKFQLETENFDWIGYIDLFVPGTIPTVYDHKTTSDIAKYAKTVELLTTDPQALLYAAAATTVLAPANSAAARCVWNYVQTGGRTGRGAGRTKRVELTILRDDALRAIEGFDAEVAHYLVPGFEKDEATKAAYLQNPAACGMYGGCPHRAECFPREKATKRKESRMDFINRLKASKGITSEQDINPPEQPKHNSAADVHAISRQAAPRIGLEVVPEADAAKWLPEQRDMACAWFAEIVSAESDAEIEEICAEIAIPQVVEDWIANALRTLSDQKEEETSKATTSAKPSKRKRRAKPKETITVVKETGVTVVEEAKATGAVDRDDGAMVQAGIGVLFVDCLPSGAWGFPERPVQADEIVRRLEPIGTQPHYKLEEYGRGPALAELALNAQLEASHYGSVVIRTDSGVGRDLLAVFERHAHAIVQGIR